MIEMEREVAGLEASSEIESALILCDESERDAINRYTFERVSVTNSADVHFGDRTYYEGPVVIQQYILTDDDDGLEDEFGCLQLEDGTSEETEKEDDDERVVETLSRVAPSEYKVTGNFVTVSTSECQEIEVSSEPVDGLFQNAYVSVTNSNEVHVGKKTYYKGPVTVKRMLYPKSKFDFHALESKLWLNESTDASAKYLSTISRIEWLARPPQEEPGNFVHPAAYVIINHTVTPNCSTRLECVHYIRSMQRFHIESRQWFDLGYNFLVGEDGNVYAGRGWDKVGAHTKDYNQVGIGVAFIGTYNEVKASRRQVAAFMRLMREGLKKGYLARDYKLLAARQLRPTESPGKALYEQMKKWPHWYRTLEITEL